MTRGAAQQHWIAQLRQEGMSAPEAQAKADMFTRLAAAGADHVRHPEPPPLALFVPGRVEFLGKHTDYCGGQSLVCPSSAAYASSPRRSPTRC